LLNKEPCAFCEIINKEDLICWQNNGYYVNSTFYFLNNNIDKINLYSILQSNDNECFDFISDKYDKGYKFILDSLNNRLNCLFFFDETKIIYNKKAWFFIYSSHNMNCFSQSLKDYIGNFTILK